MTGGVGGLARGDEQLVESLVDQTRDVGTARTDLRGEKHRSQVRVETDLEDRDGRRVLAAAQSVEVVLQRDRIEDDVESDCLPVGGHLLCRLIQNRLTGLVGCEQLQRVCRLRLWCRPSGRGSNPARGGAVGLGIYDVIRCRRDGRRVEGRRPVWNRQICIAAIAAKDLGEQGACLLYTSPSPR